MELIKKLESLTSVHQARQLQRQVFVAGRIKAMNESVYYNIDRIPWPLAKTAKSDFGILNIRWKKKRRFRHNGASTASVPLP